MKKFITLFIILLFFISCGIPSIKDFSSSIVFTKKYNNTFSIKLNPNGVNSSYFSNGRVNTNSPSVILLYTVTNQSSESSSSTFINQFSKDYRGTGGVNGLPITIKRDSGIVEITKSNTQVYLYPLKEYNQEITPPGYTIKNNINYSFDQNGTDFSFTLKQYEDGFTVIIKNNRTGSEQEFYRFIGNGKFQEKKSATEIEYRNDSDSSDKYYIHIFAAVNVTKSTTSDFSNDYWSELKYIADIPIEY